MLVYTTEIYFVYIWVQNFGKLCGRRSRIFSCDHILDIYVELKSRHIPDMEIAVVKTYSDSSLRFINATRSAICGPPHTNLVSRFIGRGKEPK